MVKRKRKNCQGPEHPDGVPEKKRRASSSRNYDGFGPFTGMSLPVAVGNVSGPIPPNDGLNYQNFERERGPHRSTIIPVVPNSFLCPQFRFFVTDPPSNDPHRGITNRRQKLSRNLWTFFLQRQQNSEVFQRKIALWDTLESALGAGGQYDRTTHVFGSTLNGFGSDVSDMDICLCASLGDYSTMTKQQANTFSIQTLAGARRILRQRCAHFVSGNIELVPAKTVPILKFHDRIGNIEVDLSVNSLTSVRNTNLLYCYSQLDWRVRPLVLSLKEWAKSAGINEAKFLTLSSYTLTLMVLHFLQSGVEPPLLPSLQILYPQLFNGETCIFNLPFTAGVPTYDSKNTMSLGELLFEFFNYYHTIFDFTRDAGSIRAGSRLSISSCYSHAKKNQNSPGQWNAYVCMEEPLERTNSGRAVIDRGKFDLILKAFRIGYETLLNGDSWESLLQISASLV